MNKSLFIALLTLISFMACKTSKVAVVETENQMETEILDTLTIDGNDPEFMEEDDVSRPYQPAATRHFDLLHTKLDLSFNYEKQWVIGKAELELKPYFSKKDSLVLDAKGMEIQKVTLIPDNKVLAFKNTGQELIIFGTSEFKRNDTFKISIQYIARPNEGQESGSDAILSDKGLFFINPLGTDTLKPIQIWTQGETENNSRWFPTIDKPNERCTGEIKLTVDSKYITLSNGRLSSSILNGDGSRTDTWLQEKPHAPYLFMLAVGEYHVQEENWNGIPLQYIVEKKYAPYAKKIFNHTPAMMAFFSNAFGVPYPWNKYSQIVTRDYVSGAMENTTASVFGEFVQKTDRELIDNDNDYIVAHELSHQWFGNLVTLESWANLVLNEGFANYSEYLWMEHQYGRMKADEHRLNELSGYINSTFNGMHPLIHYRYANKEDMFDAHSYNKGGLVLHHLRKYLGDEVFFASLQHYLTTNAFTSVEGDELRMAFEEISGEDLNWFFDQWFHKKGHPEVTVSYELNQALSRVDISVYQESSNVWAFPADIAIYYKDGSVQKQRFFISSENEKFSVALNNKDFAAVVFDGENHIPGVIDENKTEEQWLNTYRFSPMFADKFKSFQMLGEESAQRSELISLALKDNYYYFRDLALNTMMEAGTVDILCGEVIKMAEKDTHSLVRESALRALSLCDVNDKADLYKRVLSEEKAYNVLGEALTQLFIESPVEALTISQQLTNENTAMLSGKIASLYAGSGDKKFNAWFYKEIAGSNPYQMFELCSYYNLYLINQDENIQRQGIELYKSIALDNNQNKYRRYIGTASLFALKNSLSTQQMEEGNKNTQTINEIIKAINSIKVSEKDRELIQRYSEF